jgi:hypothetical protein
VRLVRTEDELMTLSDKELASSFVQFNKIRLFPDGAHIVPLRDALKRLTPLRFGRMMEANEEKYLRIWVGGYPTVDEIKLEW